MCSHGFNSKYLQNCEQDILYTYIPMYLYSYCTWSWGMQVRSVSPSNHYFPAEHASRRLSLERYNHQKLLLLKKKNLLDLPCGKQRSLCASQTTTSLRLANRAAQQLACHMQSSWGGKGGERLVWLQCVFGFCSVKWPGSFMIFPCWYAPFKGLETFKAWAIK